nr:MAG TPA: hypothetical protein [Caudoviricetes sp.]
MDTKFKSKDYKGLIVNGITLLEKTDKKRRNAYLWKCKCHCGNIFYAEGYRIANSEIKSCGCSKKVFRKENLEKARNKLNSRFVNGTFLSLLNNEKMNKKNKYGHAGISKKGNKYIARITIARKTMSLGSFDTLEEAIKVRKQAENKYYAPILKKQKNLDI